MGFVYFLKVNIVCFFFQQETAYEIRLSLVGSEMFIRDGASRAGWAQPRQPVLPDPQAVRWALQRDCREPAPNTHLPLPTNREEKCRGVGGGLKKKKIFTRG